MAPHSMTGFARLAFAAGQARLVWELKSVNARGLEVKLRLPPGLDHLESDLRRIVRERLSRGACWFALAEEGGRTPNLRVNEAALALVLAAARRLADEAGLAPPTADGLLAVRGIVEEAQVDLDDAAQAERDAAVLDALRQALDALVSARCQEGEQLAAVLVGQLAAMESAISKADALARTAPDILRARIREQIALIAPDLSLDSDRLHQEAVLAASKADVREEIDRLYGHVAAARRHLSERGPVGRRLDFLAQELNREANTLCSKAFDRRLTEIGIDLKALVEQFREQVQNLE